MISTINSQFDKSSRILILDEEEFLSWCIGFELKSHGFEVRCAGNIKIGMEALHNFRPRLIICDQDFSDGKSLEMISMWNMSNQAIPVILITADTPPSSLEMASAQASTCLRKPFEMKELLQKIDDALFVKNLC